MFSAVERDGHGNEIVSSFNDLILFVLLTFILFTSEAVTVSTNETYFYVRGTARAARAGLWPYLSAQRPDSAGGARGAGPRRAAASSTARKRRAVSRVTYAPRRPFETKKSLTFTIPCSLYWLKVTNSTER